ncbi:hypothetical protein FOMPIDRAFT_147568 [Fomitopsis schrenkii]|uniref:Uncharacterized protein n=1 Tax=Fomitopsis schrenkii TaxID=2126942 RepID=S8FD81_FOMSC|nr:hypothetical protein FOMPIDRAFT_147568 [Fomitopsis schrenkii]
MTSEQAFVSVYIYYRLDGSKAAYMRSQQSNDCKFYTNFTGRDISFLQLPGAGRIMTLESWEEAKVCCKWPVMDSIEDELVEVIRDQVEFLQKSEAAGFLRLLEISKIVLVLPRSMSVDKKKILQSEGLLAQHDAAEAGERAKNDALTEKAGRLQREQCRLTNEISRMSSASHPERGG